MDPVKAGVDFSLAVFDESVGKMCVTKEEEQESVERQKILECTHKSVEKCHYTYITQFLPSQEESCEENFEKSCQITFRKQAYNETVRKCYRPTSKVCNGQGPEECRTVYESSCTTKYVEKRPGKFVADTGCEKLPVKICGAGCTYEQGEEECHDKTIVSVVDVPEEVCDLNPQKTCRLVTKLVPRLKPKHQCTIVPQEVCQLKFSAPSQVTKPLITKWCLDDSPLVPGELYDESNALGPLEEQDRTSLLPLVDVDNSLDQGKQDDKTSLSNPDAEGRTFVVPPAKEDNSLSGVPERSPIEPVILPDILEDVSTEKKSFLPIIEFGAPPNEFLNSDEHDSKFNSDTDTAGDNLKNFLERDLDTGDYDQGTQIEVQEFKTFVDDSFPTQDFAAFVDFQDF